MTGAIETARKAAATYLTTLGFAQEAAMAASGEGDDFAEVRMALALIEIIAAEARPAAPRFARRLVGEEC